VTKTFALTILALSFATAAAAQGPPGLEKKVPAVQSGITIKIAGLHCSTSEGSDTFSATSYSFGADNSASTSSGGGGGAGKATVLPLNAMKKFDECSPALFGGVVTGQHFQTVDLIQQDEKHQTILIINLSDALITSYRIGGSQASDAPVETLQIDFRKICISEPGGSNKLCFDRATNTTS
jgi:type VI protein secretion system component Hcp